MNKTKAKTKAKKILAKFNKIIFYNHLYLVKYIY